MNQKTHRRVIKFPSSGYLIVASDLQGNLDDFLRIEEIFREKEDETGCANLLFLGDLIHGHHNYTKETWPNWLGNYYEDKSIEIIEKYQSLQKEFPDKVLSLLGNHEHSQIGGIWLEGYSDYFEESAGNKLEDIKEVLNQLPLVVLTPCGVVFSHACPSLEKGYSVDEMESIKFDDGYREMTVYEILEHEPLSHLIWSRVATKEEVDRFLKGLSDESNKYYVSVCGHDPVDEGYDKAEINQMVLSTSYCMQDSNKTYLCLDLIKKYNNVNDFMEGIELLSIYP